MIPHFESLSHLSPPAKKPGRNGGGMAMKQLEGALRALRPGIDCISLTLSQAQSARLIAAGMGYDLVSDGWREKRDGCSWCWILERA